MKLSIATIGIAGIMIAAGLARGADLDASTELDTDTVAIPLESGAENVAYKATAAFGSETGGYDFGDRNADDGNDAVTPPGLSMGANYLRHLAGSGDSRSIRINLNGGDLTASGGYIATDARNTAGNIVLFNVGDVIMGDGYLSAIHGYNTSSGQSGDAGAISIGQDGTAGPRAGTVQVAKLDARVTYSSSSRGGTIAIQSSGDVAITNASGVAGDIFNGAVNETTGWSAPIRVLHNGAFRAGLISSRISGQSALGDPRNEVVLDGAASDGAPTGSCVVDEIDTRSCLNGGSSNRVLPPSDVTIRNYISLLMSGPISTFTYRGANATGGNIYSDAGNVLVTNITGNIKIAGIRATGRSGSFYGGEVLIHGEGDVLIEDGAEVAQDILTGADYETTTDFGFANWIRVHHQGAFRANRLSSQTGSSEASTPTQKGIDLNGAILGGAPVGACEIGSVDTRAWISGGSTSRGYSPGGLSIRNYTSVAIAGDILTHTDTKVAVHAGGDAGDIAITNISGNITIGGTIDARYDDAPANESKRGTLTLQAGGKIVLNTLSLYTVEKADFDADAGVEIEEDIIGDDNTPLSGNGSALDNAGNLYLPTGQTMTYRPEFNAALNEGTYTLNGGGTLKVWTPSGTVILFR